MQLINNYTESLSSEIMYEEAEMDDMNDDKFVKKTRDRCEKIRRRRNILHLPSKLCKEAEHLFPMIFFR